MPKKKIFLIGELIIDRNFQIKASGRAAEFNAPKNILIRNYINLGGAGMVYAGLNLLKKKINFFSITNLSLYNKIPKTIKKNLVFDKNYRLEKNRFWKKNKMIMQLNDSTTSKIAIKKFQNRLINEIQKFNKDDTVIFSDYRHLLFETKFTRKIIKLIKAKGITIYVDQQSTSKIPDLYKFKNVNFLILNKIEFLKALNKYKVKNSNFKTSLRILQSKLGIKQFVVKMGKEGSIYLNKNKLITVKAYKNDKNLNPIGAGDFFLAKFVVLNKKDIAKRLFEANKFAYEKISNKINFNHFTI